MFIYRDPEEEREQQAEAAQQARDAAAATTTEQFVAAKDAEWTAEEGDAQWAGGQWGDAQQA